MNDTYEVSMELPSSTPKKMIYFIKGKKSKVTAENMTEILNFGEVSKPLENLAFMTNDILLQFLENLKETSLPKDLFSQLAKFVSTLTVTLGQSEVLFILLLFLQNNIDYSQRVKQFLLYHHRWSLKSQT